MKIKRLLLLSVISMLILSSCAQAQRSAATEAPYDNGKSVDNYMGVAEAPMDSMAPAAEMATSGGTVASGSAPVKQMVIQNASINILVDDPIVTLSDVMKMAEEMGGFTVSSNSYQTYNSAGEQIPAAAVTIRVPSEKLNEALDRIKAMTGDPELFVTSLTVSGEDVTQSYTDLQSRLRNLEEAEIELTKMYEKAVDAADVLAIYNQKLQVTEQIEVIKGQMQYYEQASAKSAINVTISAKASTQPITVAGWQPKGVARDAIQALMNFLKGLVNFLIWFVLMVMPVLLIIGLPIFFFVRWLVRRNKAKKGQLPPLPTEKK